MPMFEPEFRLAMIASSLVGLASIDIPGSITIFLSGPVGSIRPVS